MYNGSSSPGTVRLMFRSARSWGKESSMAAWTDPRAVFFAPHPDDETLGMGVAVANHVAAGRQVRVVAVTGGGASATRLNLNGSDVAPWWGVPHNPAQEGYAPLDVEA